jgi:hypothetical protein
MNFSDARKIAKICSQHSNRYSADEIRYDVIASAILDAHNQGYDKGYDDGREKEPNWRKIYAGQFMQSLLITGDSCPYKELIKLAYEMADKMIEEDLKI